MRIDEQHIAEPGLVVLEVTGADEDTVRVVMEALQDQWATSGVTPVWRILDMLDSSKTSSDGRAMWEGPFTREVGGEKITVYKSTWTWAL
ncbi:DUF6207 family protein [Streptomyces sp. NPDC093600]|uniref:DUF6207 family protein n=1 Tax=Streptomyces sp. NPDC093600 TaxID=3366047 RepID=UPI00380C6E8F